MLMRSDVSGGRATVTIGIPPSRWRQRHQVPLKRSDARRSQELWGALDVLSPELTWIQMTRCIPHVTALWRLIRGIKKAESFFMCISWMYKMFPPSSHRPKLQPKCRRGGEGGLLLFFLIPLHICLKLLPLKSTQTYQSYQVTEATYGC